MVSSRQGFPSWISAASATRVDFEGNADNMLKTTHDDSTTQKPKAVADVNLSFEERAFSAAGAAFISAIIVNPLDVAKTRLQAQAAGVPYKTCFETNTMFPDMRSSQSCSRLVVGSEPLCPPECHRYTGTLDVFYKVIRQEGFARLWRGTNASLALAVPTVGIYMPCYDIFRDSMEEFTTNNAPTLTSYVPLVAGVFARSLACISCYPIELARTRMQAFKETKRGIKPAGVWKTLIGVINPVTSTNCIQNLQNYRILWTGLSSQLARDVPFSAICWATLEPIRRKLLVSMGDEAGAGSILGANFAAGFVAGSIAAAVTCPLDVAKTRRQIEADTFSKPAGGSQPGYGEPQGSGWFHTFTIAAYKPYFDVDTSDIIDRLKESLFPFRGTYTEKTATNPDLYGPFWVIASVAGFMSATFVALNLKAHINSAGERWFLIVTGIFLLQLALAAVR